MCACLWLWRVNEASCKMFGGGGRGGAHIPCAWPPAAPNLRACPPLCRYKPRENIKFLKSRSESRIRRAYKMSKEARFQDQ